MSNPLLQSALTVLLLITVATGLVSSEYFYSSGAFAFYGFCITALLFAITPPPFYLAKKELVTLKTPILLFGLWCCYVLFHYFINTATLVFTIYCVVLYFLLLKATALFSTSNFNFTLFFIGIIAIASVESLYCIGQFLGWFKSQNELFTVTGSLNNPNVIAIFLALTTPLFLFLFQSKFKKIALICFTTLLIALVLLKCRAAFIGTILSVIVFYGLEYNFISWVKNKKNKSSVIALLILSLLIIIPISSQLYNTKKASADGRKFIWKLSTQMATEKPLTGYGYGFFEKEYNLFQADYIKQGKATAEELANAGPVIMPHNELLLNLVEGGIIGLLLISFFFASLLLAVKKREKETATGFNNSVFHLSYSGIIAFIVMSMVNSTMQIIPIMCLFIIYTAIICSVLEPIQLPEKFSFIEKSKAISVLYKSLIIITSIYFLYLLFGMAIADRQNKKAKLLKESGYYEQALQIMCTLKPCLEEDSYYWENYGRIHFRAQNFQEAIVCFKKAQTLSALPSLFIGAGKNYEKLEQYPQAIKEYETLIALNPTKFSYRMLLLEAYLKNKNSTKAITIAQGIIQLKPKIPSEKVNRYKNICKVLLKNLTLRKENRKEFQIQ